MILKLYNNIKECNFIKKDEFLENELVLEGEPRENITLLNPVILIENVIYNFVINKENINVNVNNIKITSFDYMDNQETKTYNYCYIPTFKRYYYINDIVFLNTQLLELHLEVDVLTSYKNKLLDLPFYISHNEYIYNNMLIDENKVSKENKEIIYEKYPNFLNTNDKQYTIKISPTQNITVDATSLNKVYSVVNFRSPFTNKASSFVKYPFISPYATKYIVPATYDRTIEQYISMGNVNIKDTFINNRGDLINSVMIYPINIMRYLLNNFIENNLTDIYNDTANNGEYDIIYTEFNLGNTEGVDYNHNQTDVQYIYNTDTLLKDKLVINAYNMYKPLNVNIAKILYKLDKLDWTIYDYKIELYLPFGEFVTLNINDCLLETGGTNNKSYEINIDVYCSIDFDTGKIKYTLEDYTRTKIIGIYEYQLATHIVFGGNNAQNQSLMRQQITKEQQSAVLNGLAHAAVGLAVVSASNGLNAPEMINRTSSIIGGQITANSLISSTTQNVNLAIKKLGTNAIEKTKTNLSSGNNIWSSPKDFILKITKPVYLENEDYLKYKGKPLYKEYKLKELTGFTRIENGFINNIDNITKDEISILKDILEKGIII